MPGLRERDSVWWGVLSALVGGGGVLGYMVVWLAGGCACGNGWKSTGG